MPPFDDENLSDIFKLRKGRGNLIGSRESTTLEFKESFNLGSLSKYARTMAAFSNNQGGYIVFGVKDNPRKIVGVDIDKFDSIDAAKLTQGLNDIFAPEIEYEISTYNWRDEDFGLIYTHENNTKPVIAKKNMERIKKGDIVYRYNSMDRRIEYGELFQIIKERINQERERWRNIFERTAKIGPENAAILNTLDGTIEGMGQTVLLDNDLLSEINFIKEGRFTEGGEPTLRLIGEVKAVPVEAIKEKEKVVGEDIYRYRPSDVCKEVEKQTGKQFRSQSEHLKAWRIFEVRPRGDDKDCLNEYCEYKEAERAYRYSKKWIEFLVNKFNNEENYNQLQSLPIDINEKDRKKFLTNLSDRLEN